MTNDDKRKNVAADSGAYVLDALDAESRARFEEQLAWSEDLRNEVTELNDTAVLLGLAVDRVTPSASLKASIMSRLDTTPQLPVEAAGVARIPRLARVSSKSAESVPEAVPVALSSADRTAQRRWFSRPSTVLTAAAAAIALILGGGVAITLTNQGVAQTQQADALASIKSAPDVQRAAAQVSTGGKATLVWSLSLRKSALIVSGLKTLPNTQTYELWYISAAGIPTPAGLLDSYASVSTSRVLNGKMSAGDRVGVTIEPAGGSTKPTTEPIVAIASA